MPSFSVIYAVEPPPSTPPVELPADVLDLVCEAVLSQADEVTRGAVATRLIREIFDSLAWLHPDPSHPERASFQHVVDEAEAHQARLERPTGLTPFPLEVAK